MQVILKWVAQFLLIPLIKEAVAWVVDYYKTKRENKKIDEEHKKKGEAYENAPVETADDEFSRLP